MEVFSIFAAIPVAFFASLLYCYFLVKVVVKSTKASRYLRIASYFVFFLCAVEFAILIKFGAVPSRAMMGPLFTVLHLLVFFLGTPALAGTLVLRPKGGVLMDWFTATILCRCFAVFLIFLQYGVSEALYGIDGVGGPYS